MSGVDEDERAWWLNQCKGLIAAHQGTLEELRDSLGKQAILEAGFAAALKVCDDHALHLHIRGGRMEPVPEIVAAKKLLDE